jgi:hypothetical protein
MKKISLIASLIAAIAFFNGCKKDNYPGHVLTTYIGIIDVRDIYKGNDVTLTTENMFGGSKISGVVVSDHSGHNLPDGLLIVQDRYRLGFIRGIAINLGTAAANYVPGDSVVINLEGAMLTKKDGILQVTNITTDKVEKKSSGNTIPLNRVTTAQILAKPNNYESVLSVIVKAGFNPLPQPADVYSGDKILNDGFGDITLHTETGAAFANDLLNVSANYYGIVFNREDATEPEFRIRKREDVTVLSSVIEIPPVIVSGFMADVKGGDGDYEYIQLIATKDINFTTTPFSVVVTNNAGASLPTGFPLNGWATGNMRTFKFNLTSGTALKGTFFYVGGSKKLINGGVSGTLPASTSIASANWIRAFNYTTTNGDGFGAMTGGLFANSGNASGVAVFEGINVDASTKPVDVIFVGANGTLFTTGPPAAGYRIANTDWYDIKNPITLGDQPFYQQGSNTLNMVYPTGDLGYFELLGGEYNMILGKWTKARFQTNLLLAKESQLSEIETTGATRIIF